ncbi:unnamed protein product [Durusdinium trenchii]|uniref:Uncharacterized protein n=1 Tax=Durusdinium trenchii TaxID=1381693 RepID=A0ABP0HRU6_9DINO
MIQHLDRCDEVVTALKRPFIDTQKTFRKTFAALEQGRLNALNGPDEGVGTERAATFLRTWIRGTLDVFTIEHGDPLALLEEEKMVEVFACLLNTLNDQGASVGLPQRWTCEALPPPEGWRGLVQELLGAAVVSCRVRLQEGDGKASGKGGKAAPSSAPAAFAPKGSQEVWWTRPVRPPPPRTPAAPTAAPMAWTVDDGRLDEDPKDGGIRDLLAPVKAPPSEPSEVDLMAVAQGAAQQASRSGAGSSISESPAKITELFAANKVIGLDGERTMSETSDLFAIANKAAEETSQVSSVSAASAGPKARADTEGVQQVKPSSKNQVKCLQEASEASEDLWAFARVTAAEAAVGGVRRRRIPWAKENGIEIRSLLDLACQQRGEHQGWAEGVEGGQASDAGLSDLFASAYKAAQEADGIGDRTRVTQASRSGVHSEVPGTMADLFGQKGPKQEPSVISDGSDLLAAARASADQEPSVVSDGSDLLAVAKGAADQADDASSLGGSDLMAVAQGAAANASRSGVQSSVAGGNVAELFGARQDFLAAAQSAEFSHSGVASDSDILGVARLAARDVSRSGVGNDSDLLGAARRAAAETSEGGTSAATAAVLFAARKGRDFEFVAPRPGMN